MPLGPVGDLVVYLAGLGYVREVPILVEPPRSNIPIPDPSTLTIELLRRELSALREIIETRLTAMDQATALQAVGLKNLIDSGIDSRAHLIADIDRQMSAQREYLVGRIEQIMAVGTERFDSINNRFDDRDERIRTIAAHSREALESAIKSAADAVAEQNRANNLAVGKSEVATQKQIDSLITNMGTSIKSLEDKISDLRTRLDSGEGIGQGQATAKIEKRADTGQVLAVIGSLVGGVILLIGIITLVLRVTGK